MSEFCYGAAIMIGLLMLVLIWETPDHLPVSRRPPSHPPGWKNIKKRK